MTSAELTADERLALAREVAVDNFSIGEDLMEVECEECGLRNYVDAFPRSAIAAAVKHGWDAAMGWVKQNYITREEAARIAERPRLQDAMLGLVETSADAYNL